MHEAENRASYFSELRQDVVDILIEVSKQNPYAKFFRSLRELNVIENTQIVIKKTVILDQGTRNALTSDEVAVIWLERSFSSASNGPFITVRGRTYTYHKIKHYYW